MFNAHVRICLIGFIVDAAVMVGLIALPFFILNQIPGGNVQQCGMLLALQMGGYALTCILVSGILSRAKHGLHWAMLGLTVFTATFASLPLVPDIYFCTAVSVVGFMGMALVWPALHSWVGAEPDPNSRKRHMVWFNLSWSSGFAVSPLFAGPLYDWDPRLPFVVLSALGVLALLLLISMPREKDHFGVASAAMLEARAEHDRISEAFLFCAWCATMVANGLSLIPRAVCPDRIKSLVDQGELRLFFESTPAAFLTTEPATKFSWPASAMALATALTFLFLAGTNRWRHRFDWLLGMQLLTAGAFYVLGETRSLVVMMLCFAVAGANHGLAFFSSSYYCLSNPDHKHRRSSINEGVVGLGGFIGSMAFGYLVTWYGFAFPFHMAPVVIILMVGVQWGLLRLGLARMRRQS